jgi:Na+-translocating ferredoxin:NAD+ oxidoreductase RnfG subunit
MMGFIWYILGLLTTGSVIFLWELSKRYTLDWKAWVGFCCGTSLVLFSIAWGAGAVLEGVPRAGSMGIMLFGLPGIISITAALRYSTHRLKRRQLSDAKPDDFFRQEKAPVTLKTVAPPVKDHSGIWSIVRYGAFTSLVIAFITGIVASDENYETLIRAKYAGLELQKINDNPVVFQVGEKVDGKGEYILIQEGQGYGGPFVFGIRIKDDAKVHEVIPLADKETPAFIKKIKEANYREQFLNRAVSENFIVGDDIDAVSGATVTTMAATEAVRTGAHIAAVEYFKLERTWKNRPWKFGHEEVLILLLFAIAFLPLVNKQPFKYIYMAATIGIVGFYLNAAISIGSLAGLLMGYLPSAREHLIWWVLVIGTISAIILIGKNVYCYKICPFYGIQFILSKVSGNRFNPSPAVLRQAKIVANFLLWLALMLIFVLQLPAAGAFEPFAMMFSLEGVGIQWYILPLSVVGAFFMSLFWCRFFCPVGSALSELLKGRKKLVSLFVKKPSRPEKIS